MIDAQALTRQCMRNATIAIAGKFQNDVLDLITQSNRFGLLFWLIQLFLGPTSTESKQLTEPLEREIWMGLMGLRNHDELSTEPF